MAQSRFISSKQLVLTVIDAGSKSDIHHQGNVL